MGGLIPVRSKDDIRARDEDDGGNAHEDEGGDHGRGGAGSVFEHLGQREQHKNHVDREQNQPGDHDVAKGDHMGSIAGEWVEGRGGG